MVFDLFFRMKGDKAPSRSLCARLDTILAERELAETQENAKAMIMAGLVSIAGRLLSAPPFMRKRIS